MKIFDFIKLIDPESSCEYEVMWTHAESGEAISIRTKYIECIHELFGDKLIHDHSSIYLHSGLHDENILQIVLK